MTEERHDSDRLTWAWPVFGLFHLRKRLLELIIKEFRGKGSKDFAHLDAMITKVNMKDSGMTSVSTFARRRIWYSFCFPFNLWMYRSSVYLNITIRSAKDKTLRRCCGGIAMWKEKLMGVSQSADPAPPQEVTHQVNT
jgi:hypothetical protein